MKCLSLILKSFLWQWLLFDRATTEITIKNIVSANASFGKNKFPIVYVYTVVPAVCKHGLPSYIKESLEQALFSQPDSTIIMVSNFAECHETEKSISKASNIMLVDSTKIISNRTQVFANLSREIFVLDGLNELWITSALRFFIMEDLMISYGYREILHVEADNMLYGNLSAILPLLREGYPGLAATPLTSGKFFITASVLWVSDISYLIKFNDFLLSMGTNKDNAWMIYLGWLRKFACCKKGGYNPDANGDGIKPFAVNEMSMLAFYHKYNPNEFRLLPVVPYYQSYARHRYVCDLASFAPGGSQVGPSTGSGVWDSNSWGQFIGGTSKKRGRDKGFTDSSHITGQAIGSSHCTISFICGNQSTSKVWLNATDTYQEYQNKILANNRSSRSLSVVDTSEKKCYTAPFVRCSEEYPWTPLWNLHVHSKHTASFRSIPCPCA
mmetsp:Transcript_15995/g.23360  ORF Transcript_15995/g.23360 Transcript_15995/m.23360 type:complete len:441 (-) Transcript_15995:63-1385(-)